jgi:TetR/AcrR family transcriptional regulator, regulator of autoinduction and epiphytic fitness
MKLSLKEQQLRLREQAILEAVNQLLAEKGYDAMTVDEVAAAIGIAKTSLYKHFESKEALAAAAMVQLLERTLAAALAQPANVTAGTRLQAVLRWALAEQLAGRMPKLPSTRGSLRETLMRDKAYMARLMEVSELLGGWIEAAQAGGELSAELPPEVVLYTLYARTCDPVVDYLRASGAWSDEQIIELMIATTFAGLAARRSAAPARPRTIERKVARAA